MRTSYPPWPQPGGLTWAQFTAQVRLFSALCVRARTGELGPWGADTLAQALKWGEHMENVADLLGAGRQQVAAFLAAPHTFADAGPEARDAAEADAVALAGLKVSTLGAASHYLLRQLLSNPTLGAHVALLRHVMAAYMALSEGGPEGEAVAAAVLAKDVCKEIGPRTHCALALEQLAAVRWRVLDRLADRGDIMCEEVRFFMQPHAIKAFGVSRALLARRGTWDAADAVRLCRKCPLLLLAIVMTAIPHPLFLDPPDTAVAPLSGAEADALVGQLLRNQAWLGLWQLEPWLLAQLAAASNTFADALCECMGMF